MKRERNTNEDEEVNIENDDESSDVEKTPNTDWNKVQINFKKNNFEHSFKSSSKNKKIWRNLKQIATMEQSLSWPEDSCVYSYIDAPPSFKPSKKYSDVSGQVSTYIDPHSKLQYSSVDEFKIIKKLPSDIIAGYLTLRRANTLLQ